MRILTVASLILLAACAPVGAPPTSRTSIPPPTTAPAAPHIPAVTPPAAASHDALAASFPRVDGSTSAGPLATAVACDIYDIPCGWQKGLFGERLFAPDPEYLEEFDARLNGRSPSMSGTHDAYLDLIAGKADIILVAREPSESELREAEAAGVTLDVRPVALDAFVFIAGVKNPVDGLTVAQARAIYTGDITNWKELGGPDVPIQAYQRNEDSGSQELMEKLVMQGAKMIDAPSLILPTMMAPIYALRDDPAGVGYSVYYYVTFMLPDPGVKLLAVDGVKPTSETIGDRSYPLTAEVYAVVRGDAPAGSGAALLRDWLLTGAGRTAIVASGYVPMP